MTTTVALQAEIERLSAEIEQADAFDRHVSGRKQNLTQLQKELSAAIAAELEEREEAGRSFAGLAARMEDAYGPVVEQLRALNTAVEEIQDLRGQARVALDRALKAGVQTPPVLPARLSARATRDRSLMKELFRLRSWAGGDP